MAIEPLPHSLSLIAIETSSVVCSVALARQRGARLSVDALSETAGEHSRRVLGMIETLLGDAGLEAASLDAVAFDAGPGAFTGLRIGCGVAQGLGFALALPLVAVTSLETLAAAAWKWADGRRAETDGGDGGHVEADAGDGGHAETDAGNGGHAARDSILVDRRALVAIDARMGQVYCGVYRETDGCPALVEQVVVCDPGEAIARFERELAQVRARPSVVHAVGNGFDAHAALGLWRDRAGVTAAPVPLPDAGTLARVGLARFRAGLSVPARDAAPVYVRDKVALDVDEQRALRARAAR